MAAVTAPLPRAFRINTGFSLPGELLLVALTILVMIFLVYPTAWIIVASFKTPATMFSATQFEFTFENYVSPVQDRLRPQHLQQPLSLHRCGDHLDLRQHDRRLHLLAHALSRQEPDLRLGAARPVLPLDHPGNAARSSCSPRWGS